jgi:hypothetical protein
VFCADFQGVRQSGLVAGCFVQIMSRPAAEIWSAVALPWRWEGKYIGFIYQQVN